MNLKEVIMNNQLSKDIWSMKYQYENETFEQFLDRVSAGNEPLRQIIANGKFLFGGRILAHRGINRNVTYSNCYVMPKMEDNIESIFDSAKKLARTYSYGGGCGLDITNLRPRNAVVNNSAKITTGAVSFMELFDLTTSLIGQNGRRGALMITIKDSHPDLEEFIDIKTHEGSITKANISIRITDDFMDAVENDLDWRLHYTVPATGEVISKSIPARTLYNKIMKNNWDWAEPAMLFWDRINNWHLMSEHPEHEFAGVNPCAEEPLMAGGSCLLGSLNLSEFVIDPFTPTAHFDYEEFARCVGITTEALNDVLDEGLDLHPLEIQKENARLWRQIGLGIMGIGDMLIKLGIRYGSTDALDISDKIAHTLLNQSVFTSALLAKEKGSFPMYYEKALFDSPFFKQNIDPQVKNTVKKFGLRNSQLLTIAPTGTLSTMLQITGGIEPMYNTKYWRKTESLHGKDQYYEVLSPIVEKVIEVTGCTEDTLPDYIITAMTLDPIERVCMQGIWQQYIDASISSTVNLPNEATVEDIANIYMQSWKQGLKGVTVYRDNCKRSGILTNVDEDDTMENKFNPDTTKPTEAYENDKYILCENCGTKIKVVSGGCPICMVCGYSPCS